MRAASELPAIEGYTLHGVLGRGGMGVVYAADDVRTGHPLPVAIKVLVSADPTASQQRRLEREARAMVAIRHPNVVRGFGSGRLTDGRLYVIMERLEGEDLASRLSEVDWLSVEDAVRVGLEAAAGLVAAHAAGIEHRDIKPSNLFLARAASPATGVTETVKVLDFGLALATLKDGAEGRSISAPLTAAGAILGTCAYMARERFDDAHSAGPRADVYSLAATIYRSLTGVPPPGAESMAEAVAFLRRARPPTPIQQIREDVPDGLAGLLMRSLSHEPGDRPESMAAFLAQLAETVEAAGGALTRAAPRVTSHILRRRVEGTLTEEQRRITVLTAHGLQAPELLSDACRVVEDAGARVVVARADQLVAHFGLTRGDGDEPVRAVRAALRLLKVARCVVLQAGVATVGEDRVSRVRTVEDGAAEGQTLAAEAGVVVDRMTAERVLPYYRIEGGVVVSPDDADPPPVELPFVGRDLEEMEVLRAARRAFPRGPASRLCYRGPIGVGKSRLLRQASEVVLAHYPNATRLASASSPNRQGEAWSGASDWIREALRLPRQPGYEELRLAATSVGLAAAAPFLGLALGLVLPADAFAAGSPPRDVETVRQGVLTAVVQLLQSVLQRGPVLLLLDDVQWLDPESVEALDLLLRRAGGAPLLVLGTERNEAGSDPSEAAARLFRGVDRELTDLEPAAAQELVIAALDDLHAALGEHVVAAIVDTAGGNPLHVRECVAHVAVRFRRFGRDGIDPDAPTLPHGVQALLRSRLDHFDPLERDLLKRASVLGARFSKEAVEHLGVRDAAELLRRLVAHRIVSPPPFDAASDPALEEYLFVHPVMREVAYDLLTDAQRPVLHRLAAEWLLPQVVVPRAEVADHCQRGGDLSGAGRLWLEAAEQAERSGSGRQALLALGHAIACGGSPAEERARRTRRAALAVTLSHWELVADDLAAIDAQPAEASEAEPVFRRAQRLYARGRLLRTTRGGGPEALDASIGLLTEAAESFAQAGATVESVRALGALAVATSLRAPGTGGWELAHEAVARAGEDAEARAVALSAQFTVALRERAKDEALAIGREAVAAASAVGDERTALGHEGNLAYLGATLGQFEDAAARLERNLAAGREAEKADVVGYALLNLGLVRHRLGQSADALTLLDEAREAAERHQNVLLGLYAAVYRGLVLRDCGELSSALTVLTSAAEGAADPTARFWAHVTAAGALAQLGRSAQGLELLALAESARPAGPIAPADVELLDTRATLLEATGAVAEAAAARSEARRTLLSLAEHVAASDAARQVFLGAFALHRRVLASSDPE